MSSFLVRAVGDTPTIFELWDTEGWSWNSMLPKLEHSTETKLLTMDMNKRFNDAICENRRIENENKKADEKKRDTNLLKMVNMITPNTHELKFIHR